MILRAAVVLLAVLPATASAAQAPGRVVLEGGVVRVGNVDASGAGASVATPDGGAILAGANGADRRAPTLTRLRADGSLDPSFGSGGRVTAVVPRDFSLDTLLRRPDGRLLLVGSVPGAAPFSGGPAAVVGLTDAGAPDPGFGNAGVARLVLQVPLGGDDSAVLQPDGALLVAGVSGTVKPSQDPAKPDASGLRWQVARLTATGAPDPAFGTGGTVTVDAGASGYGVAVAPGGRILTLGIGDPGPRVAALTPTGAPDPAFHGGTPLLLPVSDVFALSVDLQGRALGAGSSQVVRVGVDGSLDAGFGTGGVAAVGEPGGGIGSPQLLPRSDGGLLVARATHYDPIAAGKPGFSVTRLTAAGAVAATTGVQTGFGGGIADWSAAAVQDGFLGRRLLPRADGSFLLTGGVRVVDYTGEGEGFSSGLPAVVGLTPALMRDAAFGGPQQPARFAVRLPAQRAATAVRRRAIVVRTTASGAGLATVRVRDGHRRVLAEAELPAFTAGSATLHVRLTKTGRLLLARGGARRVTVGFAFRDVLTARARGEVVARLR